VKSAFEQLQDLFEEECLGHLSDEEIDRMSEEEFDDLHADWWFRRQADPKVRLLMDLASPEIAKRAMSEWLADQMNVPQSSVN
jgi:hypothetical protein